MASHHNGDMYDWMIKGDPALEDIFRFDYQTQTISMRGRSGVSDGAHVMTGPVYICGAEPGDTLKIEILDMKPRKNPVTGRSYAANGIADWGWQKRIVGNRHVDSTFIYEIIMDADGYAMWAEPRLYFKWKDEAGKPLVKVPCWPTN
ncbi:acetamidase, partial [Haematococcus lacustris]